ncbi:MAG: 2-amino-4-hydroxy-6-hydroxymethyldihydropteridine diphosphokinase [Muribaculaceae bacterium]|nr:2-amino-4-hydroxy-6-hydroxymethyldihydropteridine diphosphokinase [Muribaculaceae bacterium]
MIYYINIGSNLGDRYLNIGKAVEAIERRFGRLVISNMVESEPWGFDSTNLFVNVGIAFEAEEDPEDVLRMLQAIEREISPASHRNPDGSYADRIIDIDIMEAEGVEMHTPILELPHPRLAERPFFLEPLLELKEKLKSEAEVTE